MHVVIIGAGAAGLTAASSLRDKGYNNITILERQAHAGGKCSTVDIQGHLYELGAGMLSVDNTTAMSLAKRYNIRLERVTFGKSLVLDTNNQIPLKKRTLKQNTQLVRELLRYRAVQKKYKLSRPGFAQIHHEELSVPFAEFAKKHRFELFAKELEHSYTGFGYGYFADVPAAYVLKYFSWGTVKSFILRSMYVLPDGIQHLWTAVAKDFTIKYGAIITSIKRDHDVTITLKSSDSSAPETLTCDRLIVTSPLDEMLTYTDATPDESRLFSDIQHIKYTTIACSVTDFPKRTGFAPGSYTATRAGDPVFWYHRHPDTDVFTFYVLKDTTQTDDDITKNIEKFITTLGGTIGTIHVVKNWKYFPHVSSGKIRAGFYDSLENIQGQKQTYYAGELLNFSTVGLTSQYSEALVKKFF